MAFEDERRRRRWTERDHDAPSRPDRRSPPDNTGLEAVDLRALVDSRASVTVVLTSGERLHGQVRYYDDDCFSIGPSDGGPKIFLRKSCVSYLYEEATDD